MSNQLIFLVLVLSVKYALLVKSRQAIKRCTFKSSVDPFVSTMPITTHVDGSTK